MPEYHLSLSITSSSTKDAAWSAFREDRITWLNDEHGHIAAIVPPHIANNTHLRKKSEPRVLTMSGLDDLAALLRAVQAGTNIRWYPIGSEGEAPNTKLVLRAFTNEDGSLYSNEADIRDAYVWMSGIIEHFKPVSEVLKAINNASTGNDGQGNPMAVIEWDGSS